MAGMLDQMFADAGSTSDKADRLEMLKSALNASVARADARKGRFVMKEGSGQRVIGREDNAVDAERLAAIASQFQGFAKDMDSAQSAQVAAALAELDQMSKDVTAGAYPAVGSPGNLRPYDLEAPAKILVPRFTPLLNETPRVKGQGGAREYRRILGYTNSGMGGVADQDIFFNSESNPAAANFGALTLRRGNKISYSMDVHTVAYVEASVSDLVTYKAQFSNMGFENSRALSHMALLWAHKLGEEKALLFGRGNSAQGYAGAFNGGASPASPATTSGGTAAGSAWTGTAQVTITYRAGVGETQAAAFGTISTAGSAGAGLQFTMPAAVAGMYGFNVYVNIATTTSGAGTTQPGVYFAGFYPASTTGTVTINPALLVNQTSATPGTLPNSADNTSSNGYDGLLTVLTNPSLSGYVNAAGGSVATNGDKFIQDACQSLFQSVYADPDEVWLNVAQSRSLGDYLKQQPSATATSFRMQVDNGGAIIGANVTGVYNQSSPTRKMLDLRVHPYMPTGCSIVRSRTLDIPDSGVGDTSQVISVQEYMAVDWPEIQFTYDASTYWLGTYVHYAPAWSGAITGLS